MQITERILLFITAAITAISAVFCVISLGTSSWVGVVGLYCAGCPSASAGLSIISFILLIASFILLILLALHILPQSIRLVAFIVLFLATIFTLSTYASYFDSVTGYSFKLMVVAHVLCYVASLCTAFWIGGSYATRVVTPSNPSLNAS